MKSPLIRSQLGQTAVEYLLLVAVSFTLGVIFLNKMKDYFGKNPNSYMSKQMKSLEKAFQQDTTGRYRYYRNFPRY